jgi:aryl-alcohol dehydrogenase-like predicted oxidoreductase
MLKISKVTLGTAQLGMNYGIANIKGKPDFNTSINILKYSWDHGINAFDTAPFYGNSEKIIGSFISSKIKNKTEDLVVISKLPKIQMNLKLSFENLYNYVKNQINLSLRNLNLSKIPIYLLHGAKDILLKDGLVIECLTQIKSEGLIDKFGISGYNPEDVESSLEFKEIDVIQIPLNIFDHRLIKTGLLKKLKEKRYLIFARSIFLQGILFIPPEKLPKNLDIAKRYLILLNNLSKEFKISIPQLAFLFVKNIPEITSLIIGSEKIEQIAQNIKFLKDKPLLEDIYGRIIEEFNDIPENIINPTLWKI